MNNRLGKSAQINKLVQGFTRFKDTYDHVDFFKHITYVYKILIDVTRLVNLGSFSMIVLLKMFTPSAHLCTSGVGVSTMILLVEGSVGDLEHQGGNINNTM